jgi:hypothetical protein
MMTALAVAGRAEQTWAGPHVHASEENLMCFHTLDEITTFQATVFAPTGDGAAPPATTLRIDRMDTWSTPAPAGGPPLCFCYTYAPEPRLQLAVAGR